MLAQGISLRMQESKAAIPARSNLKHQIHFHHSGKASSRGNTIDLTQVRIGCAGDIRRLRRILDRSGHGEGPRVLMDAYI
jgi:hypothetical protein